MSSPTAPSKSTMSGTKRPFVRMRCDINAYDDLGALGAFSLLKNESASITRTGVALVLSNKGLLESIMHPYLSSTAVKPYLDSKGYDFVEKNSKVYEEFTAKEVKESAQTTGTVALQVDKTASLFLYCTLIDKLHQGNLGPDNMPTFFLDTAGGPAIAKKSGGFQALYPAINLPAEQISKAEQDRCIFAMKPTQFYHIGGLNAKKVVSAVSEQVTRVYELNASCQVVHVLFNWNAHSFFTYHQDSDGMVTVIVNLSPCTATMHVAGFEIAEYIGVGSAHMFPSNVFHRSGDAPRRCIKVALFFDLVPTVVIKDDKDDHGASQGASSDAPVKQEAAEMPEVVVKSENSKKSQNN